MANVHFFAVYANVLSKFLNVYDFGIKIQSTTSITDFFVVGKMSGILVRFVIVVGQI